MAIRDADECIRLDPMFSKYQSTRMILFVFLHCRSEVAAEMLVAGQVLCKECVEQSCLELRTVDC